MEANKYAPEYKFYEKNDFKGCIDWWCKWSNKDEGKSTGWQGKPGAAPTESRI